MPRINIDYSKIVIYKIVCINLNITDLYVGSTSDFRKRKNQHKTCCNNVNDKRYNIKVYQMIRANGGWDNHSMLEIEKYSCSDGNEARTRERYWIEQLNSKLNTQIPNRTRKEYYIDNNEKVKEYKKQYRIDNNEKLKEQMKEYKIENKEKIKEQRKQYRIENNEKIKEQKNKRIHCSLCDCFYANGDKSKHCKTIKHNKAQNTV